LRRRRPALEARAAVMTAVRRWFADEGFLEVDTPARVAAPGQEIHLDAIPAAERWLATSPEYAMKRLCGAGFERIVSIAKSWRAGERGPHHQSEFTLIEWYRADAPLEHLARDCEALLRLAHDTVTARAAAVTASAAPPGAFVRTTVRELFARQVGLELRGDESLVEMRQLARLCGVEPRHVSGHPLAWDDVFFQIWLDRIEPALTASRLPTFVFDWPAPLAALARRHPDDARLAERFELYAGGLELANAFGELTDPEEQRARFEAESAARRAAGKTTYPVDEALLAALGRMPPTAGIALGFDRLMMLVLGQADIRNVIAFADDEI
jgi:lysyl-tRNA synthetase class 2